jgi:hypothetical protein
MPHRFVFAVAFVAGAAAVLFSHAVNPQQPQPALKIPSGNIRDHGASGDGGDDTAAIQSGVNSAQLTGVVLFPKGEYQSRNQSSLT